MSRQSAARKKKRAMKAAGVTAVQRSQLIGALTPETITAAIRSDLIGLAAQGADLSGRLRIDVGEHPEYPGRTTIEVKASRMMPAQPRLAIADEDHAGDCDDPRCPIDHSL